MSERIRLSPWEGKQLQAGARSRKAKVEEARRGRIILGLAGGAGIRELSRQERCSVHTVRLWKERFGADRLAGLWSRHRGKPVPKGLARLEARIVDLTLAQATARWLHALEQP